MVANEIPLVVVVSLIGIIPLSVAINRYRKYHIDEYLYFIGFWSAGISIGIITALDRFFEETIYWQIRETTILIFFAMIYFQALRVIQFSSHETYLSFVRLGGLYLIFAELLVLFWN
ncbi:MAG: hypothetical protein ACC656_05500, partial [Candidatus Heimdallarchaeota archaeon]